MTTNKKLSPTVTGLLIRGRKLNISTIFITHPFFQVPKNSRQNCEDFSIMKIPNKQGLQQMPFNHSSDIGFVNFMNLCKKIYCKT